MLPDSDTMIEALYFEKNINHIDEYEDAWVFENTKKRRGEYNPVVFYKDPNHIGDNCTPYELYKKTKLIKSYDLKKADIQAILDE